MPSDVNIAVENGNTAAWVELYITNEQLAQLGYKTGDTVLTFGIRSSKSRSTENGRCADVSIDCIEYYEEDDT